MYHSLSFPLSHKLEYGPFPFQALIAVALALITIPKETRLAFGKEFRESVRYHCFDPPAEFSLDASQGKPVSNLIAQWKQSPTSPSEAVSDTDHDLFSDTTTIVSVFLFFFLLSFIGAGAFVGPVVGLLRAQSPRSIRSAMGCIFHVVVQHWWRK